MLGMMRAVINRINLGGFSTKTCLHPNGQGLKLLLTVVATANASLIGYNDNTVAEAATAAHQAEDTWHKLKVIDTMHIATININHAIAIKE